MIRLRNRRRGLTLVETIVSVAVSGFVFAVVGSLIFIASRSAVNLHEQVITQTEAATNHEQVVAMLRNAVGYRVVTSDGENVDGLKRIWVEIPATPTTTTTHTLCMARLANGKQEVQYYDQKINTWDADGYVSTSEKPLHKHRVTNFDITFVSEYRLVLTTSFVYKGFAFIFDNPGLPQHGHLVTEAIAKNHFMDQGVDNYAVADNPFSGPATIY